MKIQELRLLKGITQKDLAAYLRISPGNLCDWEKGRSEPDIAGLIKLADFFGESIDYLVNRSDECGTPISEPLSRQQQSLIYLVRTLPEKNVRKLIAYANELRNMKNDSAELSNGPQLP